VDTYYHDFKRLIKRVDIDDTMSGIKKIHYFIKGLWPEIAPVIAMTEPKTVTKALQLA
jgi:hypothetical protein